MSIQRYFLRLLPCLVALVALLALQACQSMDAPTSAATSGCVEHLVLLRWKDTVTPAQEAEIGARLVALKGQVPGLLEISFGHQSSPQAAQKGHGFNAALRVLFSDAAARDGYLVHPAHVAVLGVLRPMVSDQAVVDYPLP